MKGLSTEYQLSSIVFDWLPRWGVWKTLYHESRNIRLLRDLENFLLGGSFEHLIVMASLMMESVRLPKRVASQYYLDRYFLLVSNHFTPCQHPVHPELFSQGRNYQIRVASRRWLEWKRWSARCEPSRSRYLCSESFSYMLSMTVHCQAWPRISM